MSTTAEKLQTIIDNKAAIKQAIIDRGGQVGDFTTYAEAIANLPSGGGVPLVEEKDVNFYDYDGTLLFSYTLDEAQSLAELPTPNGHEGLIFDGWNWDYDDVIALDYPMDIGALYVTDDGATRLYIEITNRFNVDVPLYFSQSTSNGVTIDWGDGSIETLQDTGYTNTSHHYNDIGVYCIQLLPADDCNIILGTSGKNNSMNIFGICGASELISIYPTFLKKAEIGKNVTMGDYAFRHCVNMDSVTLHNGIKWLWYVFDGCKNLKAIMLPKYNPGTTSWRSLLSNCSSLEVISISNKTTSLPLGMISKNNQMKHICIPDAIMKIQASNTFEYNIFYIRMPRKLTTIGGIYTKQYCLDFSSLEQIPNLTANSITASFDSPTKIIIVPDNLYDEWIVATNWSTYATYIIKKSEWDASKNNQ